jgi:DNA polymerase (family X)
MNKSQLLERLEEMAILLELNHANPFKIRAYQNAVRTLETTAYELDALLEKGVLEQLKGIGKGLSQQIRVWAAGEPDPDYETLKAETPAGLFEMLQIPGLGPKKVSTIYAELGIASLGELEYACHENRLVTMKGFGAKTQTNILKGLDFLKTRQGQFLYPFAQEKAQALIDWLQQEPRLKQLSLAGSLRRFKEVVKDVDLVGACADADREAIMAHLLAFPQFESVIGQGLTKTSMRLKSGLSVDFRLVTEAEYPHLLLHMTGSKEHNTALRALAQKQGLKVNEYGLFRQEERVFCATEAEIFATLGLPWIPPELREDGGEFEMSEASVFTDLVQAQDLKGVFHAHTTWSDGAHSLEAMVKSCQALGYSYLGVSEHSQSAVYAHGLEVERVKAQWLEIDAINARLSDFRVFKGIEVDILPDGNLDYDDDLLSGFDFVIASVHSRFKMSEAEMTQRILKAVRHPRVTMIGHLTGRILLAREGYPVNVPAILEACAETGTVMELNAHPSRLDLDWRYGSLARQSGVKLAISPDAHSCEGLDVVNYGVGIARKGGWRRDEVINTKSLSEISDWLRKV